MRGFNSRSRPDIVPFVSCCLCCLYVTCERALVQNTNHADRCALSEILVLSVFNDGFLGLGLASSGNLSYQTTLVPYQFTLVLYQIIWHRTKEIRLCALHATCLVLLCVRQTSHCVFFIRIGMHLLAFCTHADSSR